MRFVFLDAYDRIPGERIDLAIAFKAPAIEARGVVPSYIYNIVLRGTHDIVGTIDLRIGMNENLYYGGHIGYAIEPAHRGNRYAAEACRLLRRVAEAHGMDKVLITCNPENVASRKTCEAIGATLERIVELPPHNDMYAEGERRKCIYLWRFDP
ncbi:GNAT family N-acetyltransferase [Paenibacillus sp.]|uniref:GNAT family N-acetyltransferase n=1 Tax=Paenibacillus sp. TaxID=58172 RepID=UPI002D5373DA|nr:GNAT family N-acetyltransferase [Paenibacillus sp.]HZG56636.1 GNAT family N-acetyltransferase [Paenibacillus sp.]